jgi:hypothetical protein
VSIGEDSGEVLIEIVEKIMRENNARRTVLV